MSTSQSETWLQTNFGNAFDFLDPQPEQIGIEDIALALARIPRFGAKTKPTEHTYSVAQHSVLVSHLVESEYALAGLLHDAAEGLLGFDMPTPVKDALPEFKTRIEEPIDRAVFARFGIPWEHMAAVKKADLDALMIERDRLVEEAPRSWIVDRFYDWSKAPLLMERSNLILPVLSWQDARDAFLCRFRELRGFAGYRRPTEIAIADSGWTWDGLAGDYWRAKRLGEGKEWMGFKHKFPHVRLVDSVI